MSAWRKYMKPILIGGGTLAGIVLLSLAVAVEGCESRPFTKKVARRPVAAGAVPRKADRAKETEKEMNRRELDELLSLE